LVSKYQLLDLQQVLEQGQLLTDSALSTKAQVSDEAFREQIDEKSKKLKPVIDYLMQNELL